MTCNPFRWSMLLLLVISLIIWGCDEQDPSNAVMVSGGKAEAMGMVTQDESMPGADDGNGHMGAGEMSTVRCGVDWPTANMICGAECQVDQDCQAGQRCFRDLAVAPCEG